MGGLQDYDAAFSSFSKGPAGVSPLGKMHFTSGFLPFPEQHFLPLSTDELSVFGDAKQ